MLWITNRLISSPSGRGPKLGDGHQRAPGRRPVPRSLERVSSGQAALPETGIDSIKVDLSHQSLAEALIESQSAAGCHDSVPAAVAEIIDDGFQRPVEDQAIIQQRDLTGRHGRSQLLPVVFGYLGTAAVDEDVFAGGLDEGRQLDLFAAMQQVASLQVGDVIS